MRLFKLLVHKSESADSVVELVSGFLCSDRLFESGVLQSSYFFLTRTLVNIRPVLTGALKCTRIKVHSDNIE